MKKQLFAAALAALTFSLVGCQQPPPTTPPTQDRDKETNIRIRTPGADVDIHGKGKKNEKGDTNVDVDVHRKDKQNP